MTRLVDAKLQAALDSGATTLCMCWRIDRSDGLSFGFTDHDEPVAFDGLTFEPTAGEAGAAAETKLGLAIGDAQIAGAFSSEAISAEELSAGLWDGARVRRWRVDWRGPEARMLVFSGFLGEVERGAHGFTAQLDGPSAPLNRPMGRAFVPLCDARLGDVRCGVDLDAPQRRVLGTVAASPSPEVVIASLAAELEARWAEHGRLVWTGGRNAGRASVVRTQADAGAEPRLELWTPPPFPVAPGDAFRLEAGCDKRLVSCATRFANAANFRGFPHILGDGWIAGGPSPDERNDGGSRNG